jgi:cytoskeletal protein CcmA (bactofilin family)
MATELAPSKGVVRCPICGTDRLSLRKERDPIDRLYQTPSRRVQRWLNGEAQLYHCHVCRVQFYDDREMAPPKAAGPGAAEDEAGERTRIGASVTIKGRVSGAENIVLDGEIEGVIELPAHRVTVGPAGRIRGNIRAGQVTICSHAVVIGEIRSGSLAIQEGAYVKATIAPVEPAARAAGSP